LKTSLEGRRLGPYTLLEHLASGGMAEIFLARYEAPGPAGFAKPVVLKVLQERWAEHPEVVAMFLAEARLGAELRHPGIVDVYDAGEADGLRYIVMEHIEGRTLADLVLRSLEVSRPLPPAYAAFVAWQVADGLAYLQDGVLGQGRPLEVVHRDLSPENLVVSHAGQTKIIDFGVARRGGPTPTHGDLRPGKVSYMSPEQVMGQPADGRSDIFALGTILYEIGVGRRLWRGPAAVVMRRIVEEPPPPPSSLRRDLPRGFDAVTMRALAKRPEDRHPSAAALAEELGHLVAAAGEPVGNRQIARFVADVFAPEAVVSTRGAGRAAAFLDDEAPAKPVEPVERAEPSPAPAAHRAQEPVGPPAAAAASAPTTSGEARWRRAFGVTILLLVGALAVLAFTLVRR
jgi:serine/threonine protein kinase